PACWGGTSLAVRWIPQSSWRDSSWMRPRWPSYRGKPLEPPVISAFPMPWRTTSWRRAWRESTDSSPRENSQEPLPAASLEPGWLPRDTLHQIGDLARQTVPTCQHTHDLSGVCSRGRLAQPRQGSGRRQGGGHSQSPGRFHHQLAPAPQPPAGLADLAVRDGDYVV